MFKKGKTHQQKNLFGPYYGYSEAMKKRLENSWASSFFEHIFLAIREERFAVLYSEKYSRPNVPVQTMVSLLILKELNQLTDEALIDAFYFDYRFDHALGIENIDSERICINTLTHFRKRLLTYEVQTGRDLLGEEIAFLSEHLAESIQLDRSFGRMDSMLISSNCKKMSRIELIYTVNRNMVRAMNTLDGIDIPETYQAYLKPSHQKEMLYRLHMDETQTRTDFLLEQSLALYHLMKSSDQGKETEAFTHLARLIEEQTVETEEGTRIPLRGNELPSGNLNNPSDPDATFRKKGNTTSVGYTLNFLEIRDRDKNVGLLLHYDVKANCYSDQAFGEDFVTHHPLMESLHTLVCDGAYDRVETLKKAKEKQVEFHVTIMTGGTCIKQQIPVDHFVVDQ
ncbi:transposase [Hazenella sp. IB182357]|uniref:Transposase n=1 Tax=Polycladospora coralii TaxID=2771432 RepID=A0A926NGY3_9BACL|nr:transposase [Polycladospora coralii]MBD1373143.1 transposase [Polycladospora coralii]